MQAESQSPSGPESLSQPSSRPSRGTSLKLRFLGPLVLSASLIAIAIAGVSYWVGARQAETQLEERFQQIRSVLTTTTYQLNPYTLQLLSELTGTEMVSVNERGQVLYSTLEGLGDRLDDSGDLTAGGRRFRVRNISAIGGAERTDSVSQIAVLFDYEQISSRRRQAVWLPLLTGLCTVVVLTGIWSALATSMLARIIALKRRVEQIAAGNFQSHSIDSSSDELGSLRRSIEEMATELSQLWKNVHQQQSEKLIHQVAAGMAHQLRNSLTGARMAIELHDRSHPESHDESLSVALAQLGHAEDYVKRLLMVASGKLAGAVAMPVVDCADQLQATLDPVAKHLRKQLDWRIPKGLENVQVAEGSTLIAAVENLIQNAIDAGETIVVEFRCDHKNLVVTVSDDGPGVAPELVDQLFDPFVSSKPEGLGLGLAIVRRAAAALRGEVTYQRTSHQTVFRFECQIQS